MIRSILLLLPLLLLVACTNDKPAATEAPTKQKLTNEEKLSMLAPPPPECSALTNEEIQAIIPKPVTFPMPGQRSAASYYSCQIDVDGDNWIGQVVLEFPKDARKRQSVIDEVAGAEGADAVDIAGNSARIMANNKKIAVAGAQPYRITFISNHRIETEPVWTDEEVRGFLVAFAEAAL